MTPTAAIVVLLVLIALALVARAFYRPSPPPPAPLTPSTPADPSGVQLRAKADNFLTAWHKQWRLPQDDDGALVFRYVALGTDAAANDGTSDGRTGLVVGLHSAVCTPDTWYQSGRGYGVVLDNNNSQTPLSWVAHLPLINREMTGSRIAHNFRLQSGRTYWVGVQEGYVAFGEGDQPGRAAILCTRDPAGQRLGVRYFGFGAWAFGINPATADCARIEDIRTVALAPGTLR
jgi:hypothetical protein